MSGFAPNEAVAIVMLAALTLYALFGGADFGAGVWDLFARGPRGEKQRDVIAHAIGPVWEVNHIWLIIVVVLLFTGFPDVFAAIMTTMHVPLTLMLVGIVLRGSAFTFRTYDTTSKGKSRWNRLFAAPSLSTPVLLGCVIGAIAMGRAKIRTDGTIPLFSSWLSPFPVVVGFFTLSIFAYLAAVYLTLETKEKEIVEDFRRRALISAVVVGILAYAVYFLARSEAPLVFQGLETSRWGFVLRIATGFFAIVSISALWFHWYGTARYATMIQVALILWGCALAQNPYLVPPDLTIQNSAAPANVQKLLLIAFGAGSLLLFPSIFYLFRIFKTHTFTKVEES